MKKVLLTSVIALSSVAVAAPALAADTVAIEGSETSITLKKRDDGKPEENNGPLKINDLQTINFGENFISGSEATYSAKFLADDRANYIQIKDDRGTNAGWTLQVKNSEFSVGSTAVKLDKATLDLTATHVKQSAANKETGEVIVPLQESSNGIDLANGWTLPSAGVTLSGNGEAATIATAKANNGMGYSNIYLGEKTSQESKNKKIQLTIPGIAKKVDGATYTSDLTWILLSEPSI